jgi:uncharacterized membrane protein
MPFSISGLPSPISAAFTHATLAAPGSGTSILKLPAASSAQAGTYSVTVSASSGSTREKVALAITCRAHVTAHQKVMPMLGAKECC